MKISVKIKMNEMEHTARKKLGGREGMLFLANQAANLMDPYVPADTLTLATNIRITADGELGHITYNSPYAHYQYEGEVYGPNYPIFDGVDKNGNEQIVGFYSPKHKQPTGKRMEYSTFQHPLATDHWDKAMMTARKGDLAKAYENHLKGKV